MNRRIHKLMHHCAENKDGDAKNDDAQIYIQAAHHDDEEEKCKLISIWSASPYGRI